MKKQKIFFIAVIILVFFATSAILPGCKTTAAETTAAETTAAETTAAETTAAETTAAEPWIHGVADIITTHPFHRVWLDVQAKDIDPNFGCTSIFKDANAIIEQNIADVETLIQMEVDVLTAVPVDGIAIGPSLQKALDAGIPTQSFYVKIDVPGVVNVIGDDYGAFAQYAHLLATYLDYEGKVCYMSGIEGSSSSDDRKNGFLDAIKDYPDIEVLDVQASDWLVDKGISIVEGWLNRFPEIDAMVFVDNQIAAPAIETLKSFNRTEIKVVGYTADEVGLEAIDNGEMLFDGLISPELFGWYCTRVAYLLYKGVELPEYPELIMMGIPLVMSDETFELLKSKGVQGLDLDALDWYNPDGIRNYAKELPNIYGKDPTDAEYGLK